MSLGMTNILMTDLLNLGAPTGFKATHLIPMKNAFKSDSFSFVDNFYWFNATDKYVDTKTGYIRLHVTNCNSFNHDYSWNYSNSLPQLKDINGNPCTLVYLLKLTPDNGNLDFLNETTVPKLTNSCYTKVNGKLVNKTANFKVVKSGTCIYLVPNLTKEEFNHFICKIGNSHFDNFNLDGYFTGTIEVIPLNTLASNVGTFNTRENCVKWLERLPDTEGKSITVTVPFKSLVTAEDISIATKKGWTIA